MPGQRLPMRKIREALRLRASGHSNRQIAASIGVGPTAAGEYIRRARRTGLSWPLPDGLTDDELERCLFPPPTGTPKTERAQPMACRPRGLSGFRFSRGSFDKAAR